MRRDPSGTLGPAEKWFTRFLYRLSLTPAAYTRLFRPTGCGGTAIWAAAEGAETAKTLEKG